MGKSSGGSGSSMGDAFAAMAAMQASQNQAKIAQEQLDWAKSVYNEQQPYIMQSTQQQLDAQAQANSFAKEQQNYYLNTYQPMETQFAQQAQNYDTPASEQLNAGAAEQTTADQFSQARAATQKQLEGYGIDPSSTRYASLDAGTRTQQAAAAASAGNVAIQQTKNTGLQLESQAINTGRGYANAVNSGYGTGTGAGSASTSGLNSSLSTGSNAMGTPVQWASASNQALGSAVSAWGNYGTAMNAAYNQSSGMGSILGSAMGLAGNVIGAFADGGPTDSLPPQPQEAIPTGAPPMPQQAAQQPPMQGQNGPGGAIPAAASPSAGRAIDDVPARLTAGEFVVPKDVVGWYGEKHMYDMIAKAQADKQRTQEETTARPSIRPAIPTAPTFVSQS